MAVWIFLDYVNWWLVPRTFHSPKLWAWSLPWADFISFLGEVYLSSCRAVITGSASPAWGTWSSGTPNLLTMTADELVFFVNGKKVSRSWLFLWFPWSLGGMFVLSILGSHSLVRLLSLPSKLFLNLRYHWGEKTFSGLEPSQDLHRAEERWGGKREEGYMWALPSSRLPACRDVGTKLRNVDRVLSEIGGHPPHLYFGV